MKNQIISLMTIMLSKIKWIILACLAILAPIQDSMVAVGVLITLDFIFGIIAAKKKGDSISSRRMADSIIKMLVYQLLIISAFVAQEYLAPWLPLTKTTLSFIGMVELYSIGESFTIITGLPFLKYLKNVIKNNMKNPDLRPDEDKSSKSKEIQD